MIELVAIGAGLGAAFLIGSWRASGGSEGCNGHHWEDPKPVDGKGVSSISRERAGYTGKVKHGMSKGYQTQFLGGTVYLKQDAVKQCKDCNEVEADTILVGSVPVKQFEDSVDGI